MIDLDSLLNGGNLRNVTVSQLSIINKLKNEI